MNRVLLAMSLTLVALSAWARVGLASSPDESPDVRSYDSWESQQRAPDVFNTECFPLDAMMEPVSDQARDEAVRLLEDKQYVALDAQLLAKFLPGKTTVTERAERSARDHEQQAAKAEAFARERANEANTVAFEAFDAARERYLAAFHRLAASQRKPYLVRGVTLGEGSGAFSGTECKGYLAISHATLGRHWPQPHRRPLVVFLMQQPVNVYVATSMAE